MELAAVQKKMSEFVARQGWYGEESVKPQEPARLAMSLAIEVGELLEHFQWTGPASLDEVGDELADVVLYAAQLANVLGIDLAQATKTKLQVNDERWRPVEAAR